jgi:hypothetical protein
LKNIQVIDGGDNATFSIFQATDEEFAVIFPGAGQDIEFPEDLIDRIGPEAAEDVLNRIWTRPILKRDAMGIHGSLYYDFKDKRHFLASSKREIDSEPLSINAAQRELFARKR